LAKINEIKVQTMSNIALDFPESKNCLNVRDNLRWTRLIFVKEKDYHAINDFENLSSQNCQKIKNLVYRFRKTLGLG